MNEHGHSKTLIAAHPSNTNAVKSGIYSPRLRACRAEEIAALMEGQSTLEAAEQAVLAEVPALRDLERALAGCVNEHGVSTRAGAARVQFDQLSRVSRQLTRLARETWLKQLDDRPDLSRAELVSAGVPGRPGLNLNQDETFGRAGDLARGRAIDEDVTLNPLRERLWHLLALRDALDEDLAKRGVATRRGGARRQVGQRLRLSRDLVSLLAEIRTRAGLPPRRRLARSACGRSHTSSRATPQR